MMLPMPRIPPLDRPATYEDLEAVPDVMVAEIVDGELHASPRPRPTHAFTGVEVGDSLVPAFHKGRGGPGGWLILYEPEMHFGRDVLVPDWAGWLRSRMPKLPETPFFSVAPDWVCEILSPSTASLDRVKKLRVYAREQVRHAWLIDPSEHTLEVLRLEDGRWTILGTYAGSEIVRAEPFVAVALDLSSFWAQ
jgi:Uma2 family endonuclease